MVIIGVEKNFSRLQWTHNLQSLHQRLDKSYSSKKPMILERLYNKTGHQTTSLHQIANLLRFPIKRQWWERNGSINILYRPKTQ